KECKIWIGTNFYKFSINTSHSFSLHPPQVLLLCKLVTKMISTTYTKLSRSSMNE
ncbi:hypothetical protein RYX36_015991, partial [Vicia faba]